MRVDRIISNSFFEASIIGLVLTLLVIFTWDHPMHRYNINVDPFSRPNASKNTHWFSGDFNGDGNSERIRCDNNIGAESLDITYYDNNGFLINQFHIFQSEWSYDLEPRVIDINHDKESELVFLSTRNDSIFFSAFSLTEFDLIIDHLFIDTFEQKREIYSCQSAFFEFGDFDYNGTDELFFHFDAGFGLYPRGVFKIEFPSLKVSRSDSEYMTLKPTYLWDLNQDNIPEILCRCAAPSNVRNYNKYTDTISYITVLDYNLNFLFEPIPFEEGFSSIDCVPCPSNDTLFYARFNSNSKAKTPLSVYLADKNGEILNSKIYSNVNNPENMSVEMVFINNKSYFYIKGVGTFELTPSFDKLPDKLSPEINDKLYLPVCIDLNDDGIDEWISKSNGEILIYNEAINEWGKIISPTPITDGLEIYPFYNDNHLSFLVDTGSGFFFFNYQQNPYYIFLYIIYGLIFLSISGSVLIVLFIQKRKIENRFQTEKQMAELQFNAILNQLTPHFLFNSLNSIACMINEGKKDEAYDFLTISSRLFQQIVNDAKEVNRSLKSEILFTNDYIGIQKLRFKERFDIQFQIHPDVNMDFIVPKKCIHTYVENAIMHGFRDIQTGRIIKIDIEPYKNGISILIEDNGIGRDAASKYKSSSGNGIRIMKEYYQLFEKYYNYKINYSVSDIQDKSSNGLVTGTLVSLNIQNNINLDKISPKSK